MPIYDYACSVCKAEFEENRKISERFWKDPCPSCGADGDSVALIIKSPRIVRGVGGLYSKLDVDFKSNLKRIKEKVPNSTIKV